MSHACGTLGQLRSLNMDYRWSHLIGGPHSCIPLGTALDGRMMNCNFLAAEFVPLLQEKHTATIYHLAHFIKGKYYRHKLSYYKIWDAKQRAIAKIFKDWEESY